MASITIKDVPEDLLARLRERAREDERSMNREAIHLLDLVLRQQPPQAASALKTREVDRQIQAWQSLAGRWDGGLDVDEVIGSIYAARTPGRPVDL